MASGGAVGALRPDVQRATVIESKLEAVNKSLITLCFSKKSSQLADVAVCCSRQLQQQVSSADCDLDISFSAKNVTSETKAITNKMCVNKGRGPRGFESESELCAPEFSRLTHFPGEQTLCVQFAAHLGFHVGQRPPCRGAQCTKSQVNSSQKQIEAMFDNLSACSGKSGQVYCTC